MPSGIHLCDVVLKNGGREDGRSLDAEHSCIVLCVFDAGSLSDDAAGKRCFFSDVSAGLVSGAWNHGQFLYAGLYAELFYDLTAGVADGIDRSCGVLSGNIIPLPFFLKNMWR